MKKDFFDSTIKAEFVIITNDKSHEIVTNELRIKPHRSYNLGDSVNSKYSDHKGNRPHGLWAISNELSGEDVDIKTQIQFFQNIFKEKIDALNRLQNEYGFKCILSLNLKTEDAGIGFDLEIDELEFINKIASRFSCSFIATEKL